MLAEACNQFHARAFTAMFPNRNIIKAIPVGKPDPAAKERAERVGMHMSWQLMVQDRTYKRNKDRLLLSLPLHGSFFTKTYWCPVRKRNIVDNVRAADLVMPYGSGPRDMEEIERKSHIILMPMNHAKKLKARGFFSDVPDPYMWDAASEIDQTHDRIMGVQRSGRRDESTARIIEQHRMLDLDDDDLVEPYIVWVDTTSKKVLRLAIRYDTDELGNPLKDKEPIEYFTHYTFLENPDGAYGLGMGHLVGPPNTAVNKLIRQSIDAATLANVGNLSGFISKQLAVKKGETQIQLGKFITTESGLDDLSKGIYQFKFPGPQPTLVQLAEVLMTRTDRLATITEAITGQTEKVMQPTTIMALIEQSLQWFSTIYERVLGAWEVELEKLYRLNGKFMDPQEYFSVLDVTGQLQQLAGAREDYREDLQIKPIADPKMSTQKQKLAKAEAEWMFVSQNPLVLQSPMHIYNASKRYLTAIEAEAIDEVLPKPQPVVFQDDPVKENMGALLPMPFMPPPNPRQDHLTHLATHMNLLNDPAYASGLSEEGRRLLTEHNQAHQAMMYGAFEDGSAGTGLMGGMGASPMQPMDVGATGGPVPPDVAGGGVMGQDQPPQGPTGGSGLPW